MNQMHYSMIIQWDSRDNIFVVRVPRMRYAWGHV